MEPGNNTQFSEFFLLGISADPELQPLIFGLFLSMYLIAVFGNLLIILATISDSHLHAPMYFFLSNLSFVDICFTSTTIPKMLKNIQTQSKVITYEGCTIQVYFYIFFAGLDDFLLTVMAYDRFGAICHPLHYTVIMNLRLCALLVLVPWMMSAMNSLLQSLMVLKLTFCREVEIPHFFCELNQMVQLACSDTFLNDMVMYLESVLLAGGPFAGIIYSYSKIVSSIRRISSTQGKFKASSTCASHLSVVLLFYCMSLGVYLRSAATHSSHSSATASVMYTVVTPMLNPFIYSLRNKDIKRVLKRVCGIRRWTQGNNRGSDADPSPMAEATEPIAPEPLIVPLEVVPVTLASWMQRHLRPQGTWHQWWCHLHPMESGNNTRISQFLLLGLSEEEELQPLIFGLFLSMYLITVFGNLLIILTIISDSHLHTPMYFFLSNLSFVDICFTSTTIPKMLWNIQSKNTGITYEGCITQIYFYILFAGLDDILLTVMAYDRYVAICHPLHYMVIMSPRLCELLVLISWMLIALYSLLHSLMVLRLSFCPLVQIPHFFCELSQVVQLASSDNFLNNIVMYFAAVLMGGGPFAGILYSYSKIVSCICKITSAQGKYKAFSTCVSHLSVVFLFYFTALGVFLSSAATHNSHSSTIASVMYTVVTPMLNPFIYSLRNRDIKEGLKRLYWMPSIKPIMLVLWIA
ncbi:uncharacterized protein [Muntiacus reevesi]|uniref:uncharacterized protein n=1 Tax=Muntiacus reevesi TaxID=9886 RepID=UPI00330729E1